MDSQQVELIGRNWLITELVRSGFEVATPVRDIGVDLLVSPPTYSWTMPLRAKISLDPASSARRWCGGR